jgi:hypothetical protein
LVNSFARAGALNEKPVGKEPGGAKTPVKAATGKRRGAMWRDKDKLSQGGGSDLNVRVISDLQRDPVIASVSFGATRRFQFKHRADPALRAAVDLTHGSLLLMRGSTQHHWKHQLPKSTKPLPPRINLTFRIIR